MIKHIVMWKLKDEAEGNSKAENAKIIKNSIEDLKEKINEIVDIEVGIDVNKSDQAYDVVLYSTFNSFEKANNLIYMFILHYNFIRPHGSLNGSTPAEVAGFSTNDSNKHNWFIAA